MVEKREVRAASVVEEDSHRPYLHPPSDKTKTKKIANDFVAMDRNGPGDSSHSRQH